MCWECNDAWRPVNVALIKGLHLTPRTLANAAQHGDSRRLRLLDVDVAEYFPLTHIVRCRRLRHPGCTYMLNSFGTNSRGDDQLFPEDGAG